MDHLLFENDGSRRMANQIARGKFSDNEETSRRKNYYWFECEYYFVPHLYKLKICINFKSLHGILS